MSINLNIIEKHELVDIWPGKKNAYRCICIDSGNKRYEANIPKAECELSMFMIQMKKVIESNKSRSHEKPLFDSLVNLANEYGNEMYYKGGLDESMANAGADI